MTVYNVCKIIREDSAYADYAITSFQTCPDVVSGAPEEFYAKCGDVSYSIPLCRSIDFERLENTKNAVIHYLNERSHFFIFDHDAKQVHHDTSALEGFIMRALEQDGYSHKFIKKDSIFNIVEEIFSKIKPTSPSDLGWHFCVVL
jgi:hypothetical protein